MMKLLFVLILGFASVNLAAEAAPKPAPKEYTLTLIKPEALAANHVGEILARFEKGGLCVAGIKTLKLSKQQAEKFYEVHKERPFYTDLVKYMSSGPIVAVVLEGKDPVTKARAIMGATDPKKAAPGTIRADFGVSIQENAVHGSDSAENAKKEIAFFFNPSDIIR